MRERVSMGRIHLPSRPLGDRCRASTRSPGNGRRTTAMCSAASGISRTCGRRIWYARARTLMQDSRALGRARHYGPLHHWRRGGITIARELAGTKRKYVYGNGWVRAPTWTRRDRHRSARKTRRRIRRSVRGAHAGPAELRNRRRHQRGLLIQRTPRALSAAMVVVAVTGAADYERLSGNRVQTDFRH